MSIPHNEDMISKTPDHRSACPQTCEHSCRQVGMRCALCLSVSWKIHLREYRRSLRRTSITLGILNARAAKRAVPAFLCARSGSYVPKRDRRWGGLKSMLAVLAPAPALPLGGTQELSCTDDDHLELDRPEQCCGVCLPHFVERREDRHHGQARHVPLAGPQRRPAVSASQRFSPRPPEAVNRQR